jgi:hypothetical protein|tara:strand:- start:574 stop:678 length:105 start_codon:yes stop_codon:yes gene_type:complete
LFDEEVDAAIVVVGSGVEVVFVVVVVDAFVLSFL